MAQSASLSLNVPCDVDQLAITRQLGSLTSVYKPRLLPATLFPTVVCMFPCLIFLSVGFSLLGTTNGAWVAIVLGLICLGAALILPVHQLLNAKLRVYVFKDGLVRVKKGQAEAIRWNDVESVLEYTRKVTVKLWFIVPIGRIIAYRYTICLADGKKVVFNQVLWKAEELGNTIMRETLPYLLPKAKTAYDAGETVSFGKLSISQRGITKGEETIPWNLAEGIQVQNGFVQIKGEGILIWANVGMHQIQNLRVFMNLANAAITKAALRR